MLANKQSDFRTSMYPVSQILTVSDVLMKKIGLINQKGGAGKSTSCVVLAGALAQKYRVALVDLDPQGSLERWNGMAKLPATLEIFAADSIADLKRLKGFDYAVIDTKGELSADALPALDMALLPCIPSLFDIWSSADTIELLKAHQAHRPSLIVALFVNRLAERTRLGKQISGALGGYGLPLLKTPLRDRIAYPTCIAEGKTPTSSGYSGIRLESLLFAKAVTRMLEA
jgi:chromosome partitioning protein